jgi:hemolysin III
MTTTEVPEYSPLHEIVNSVTHGIAAAFSIAGLSVLVVLAVLKGDPWRIVSFSIYGGTLVALYLTSTLYHGIAAPAAKRFFRRLDHAVIFLLIAGTYTPFTLVLLRGAWGWFLFGTVWTLAVLGIGLKVFFMDRSEVVSIALYLLMGWAGVLAIKPAIMVMPPAGIVWMVIGGLSYSLGVIFYAWERLPFNHSIWHLFVVGGSVCHFFVVLFVVLP